MKFLKNSKQLRILSRQKLLIIVFLISAISVALLFYFIWQDFILPNGSDLASSAENMVVLQKQEQAGSGLPIRLRIPRINVNSSLEYVGLTPQGAVDVPKGPANAAWFEGNVRPGDNGSAIIVGHYGWKNGIPAVFDNLYKLQKGDQIYIEDEKGETITFVVRELGTYGENENASDVFNSSDGNSHLNLITCEGVWNKVQKSYSGRLVVFTDKE